MSRPASALADLIDGSEDAIRAFVPGNPDGLLRDFLQASSSASGGGTPFVSPAGVLYGAQLSVSLRATPVMLTCLTPASWQLASAWPPGLPVWPDPQESWLLHLDTDVRELAALANSASLDEPAPAVLLRIIARHNLLAVMDSARAPGRVNVAVVPTESGPAEVLVNATLGHEAAAALWARAIGCDVPVRPCADLGAFDALTAIDPLDHIGLQDQIAAFPAAAEHLAPLLRQGTDTEED